ncbi:MAG: VPLPA-CTERM sorting domain-containing protein [Pseudomonadota bacterium]
MLKNILKHAVVLQLALGSAVAFASTYSFTGVNANEVNVSSQLSLDVTQVGNVVDFKFINAAGGTNVFIGAVYFDFLGADLISSLTQTGQLGTVSFKTDVTPNGAFPEGNTINFINDDADAVKDGAATNGVNIGEYLILTAVLNPNANIDDLLASGGLRVGLHVQGYATGGSDSYVNAVPLPAAGWLFGSALVGLMGLRRRKL